MNTQSNTLTASNILLVDDEKSILSSLNRTLRINKYNIFTAQNANEGLKILKAENIHLVISDMQMPGMNGAQFLREARHRSPKTIRMILTGYADMDATVQAINESKIYSYISKPWQNDKLLQTISLALYTQNIDSEKKQQLGRVREHNAQLQNLNAELEAKVAKYKADLKTIGDSLSNVLAEVKDGYQSAIDVFGNMMSLYDPKLKKHCERVATLAQCIAVEMDLTENDVNSIYYAGLLHDIGKMQCKAPLAHSELDKSGHREKKADSQHCSEGARVLVPLDRYYKISYLIRHHHERFDGSGYPDQLAGDAIALGACILAVAEEFDEACYGLLYDQPLSLTKARQMIIDGQGRHYHPQVVRAFLSVVGETNQK